MAFSHSYPIQGRCGLWRWSQSAPGLSVAYEVIVQLLAYRHERPSSNPDLQAPRGILNRIEIRRLEPLHQIRRRWQ